MAAVLFRIPRQVRNAGFSALFSLLLAAAPSNAFEAVLTLPEEAEDVRKKLKNSSLIFSAQNEGITEPLEIVATAQAEYRRLLFVLYADGYFGPTIRVLVDGREAATLPPFEKIQTVKTVEIRVDPGQKFRFGRAEIDPDAPDATITEDFATGKPARTGVITTATGQAITGWRNQGHAKAEVANQRVTANHSSGELDVDIDLRPGPKLRFGDLSISGKTQVREERLAEIISLPNGETFHPDELDKISKRLRRLGTFRAVQIQEAEAPNPDGSLDINVEVQDDKRRRLTLGAELESRDGITLEATWMHRNLLGGGERLKFDAEISNIGAQTGGTNFSLGTEFFRPATFQPDTDFAIGFRLERLDDPLYVVDKASLAFLLKRVISDEFNVSGGVLFEASNSTDDFGDRQFRTFGIPFRANFDGRDDLLDPKSGYFVSGTLMPYTSQKDGKPGTYIFGDGRYYASLGGDRVVAAGRLQIGSIIGPDRSEVSPELLFVSGGAGTVRGQPYQSNFITTGGIRSGGLSFLGVSGELRIRTTEAISTVVFYDAGYVGEESDFSGNGQWHSGAGLGIRYNTGIGPIRFDVAVPVSGATSGGTQIYVGIGQAF